MFFTRDPNHLVLEFLYLQWSIIKGLSNGFQSNYPVCNYGYFSIKYNIIINIQRKKISIRVDKLSLNSPNAFNPSDMDDKMYKNT